jgi:hypothetical protein
MANQGGNVMARSKKPFDATETQVKKPVQLASALASLSAALMLALLSAVAPVSSQVERSEIVSNASPLVSADQRERLDRVFSKYQVIDLNLQQATKLAQSTGHFSISAEGKEYDLWLQPNDIRAPSYRSIITTESGEVELPRQPVSTYKGTVAGHPDSEARLLVQPDLFFGHISTGDDMLFIDPLSKFAPGAPATRVVLYRDADVHHDFEGTCGTSQIEQAAKKLIKQSQFERNLMSNAVNPTQRVIQIAAEADFEFFQINGTNTGSFIIGTINQVDGIYLRELNLRNLLTFLHIRTTNVNNPYTSSDPETLLDQFRNHWENNRNNIPRDVAHLFTGKTLGFFPEIVWGKAKPNSVCFRSLAYSLTRHHNTRLFILVAHEIGHNLNACHDDQCNLPAPDCGMGTGPIMCRGLQTNGTAQFSQRSKDDIATYINRSGACLLVTHRSGNCDFNGDGRTDFAVFRPSIGWWSFVGNGVRERQWGMYGDKPVPGDYDGDGRTDIAVWRPSEGNWYVINSTDGRTQIQQWGISTDIPVQGDYDRDGRTDFAVWRPADGSWHIINSSTGGVTNLRWGVSTDKPAPGDYDGDGRTDIAVWRPSEGNWYVINSTDGGAKIQQWGISTDKLVPGDYDRDGKTDLAVWRPSTGIWYVVNSSNNTNINRQWGLPTDKPAPGDYDGDGKTDFAVYRPSNATWYVVSSFDGSTFSQLHYGGVTGDVPVPNALVRN